MTALVAMLLVAAPVDTVRSAPCPGGEVLDRRDLEGLVLMTDVLGRLSGVSSTSIDGFDHRPHAGSAPVGGVAWLVTVDGVPIESGAFGMVDIHLLPIEPADLERVVYCPGPHVGAGRFAGSGVLELTTLGARADGAIAGRAAARIANETGDPGPRRYLEDAAPNVDKIGPDYAARVAGPAWWAGARFERRYPSDAATFVRNANALGHFPAVRYGAAGVRAGRPGSALRFDGAGAYASDLWYVESAGRELPVLRLSGQASATAGAAMGDLAAGARLSITGASVARRPEMMDSAFVAFDPAWREAGVVLDVELRSPRAIAAGVHLRGTTARGPGLADGEVGLARVWLRRSAEHRPGLRRRGAIALVVAGADVGLEGAFSVDRDLRHGTISATVARDDRLPGEELGVAYWSSRGFTGLQRPETTYRALPSLGRATEWSLRTDWVAGTPAGMFHVSVGGRDMRGLTLHEATFRPHADAGVAGDVEASGGNHGRVLTASVGASGQRGRLRWQASYRFEQALAGDSLFGATWASVPEHLFRAGVAVRPSPSLMLRIASEARSGTEWPAYEAFEGVAWPGSGRVYSASVPPAVLVDLDLEKSVLNGHLHVTASARNVFGAPERAHPLGATLAVRLWVGVAVTL